jgi:hypothetical protein
VPGVWNTTMFRIGIDLGRAPMLETVLVNFTESQMRRDWVSQAVISSNFSKQTSIDRLKKISSREWTAFLIRWSRSA